MISDLESFRLINHDHSQLAHAKVASCQGEGKMSNGISRVMMLSSNQTEMANKEMARGSPSRVPRGLSLKVYVEKPSFTTPNDCSGTL